MLTRGQVIPTIEDAQPFPPELEEQMVSALLRPGEMSIHHLCTAHGGGANEG